MNSRNSKTCDTHRLLLNLSKKNKFKNEVINMLLNQILTYTIHNKI